MNSSTSARDLLELTQFLGHFIVMTQGIQPEKPASGKLLLRVPPEIHGRALVAAQAAGKSLDQWATEVLQHAARPGG